MVIGVVGHINLNNIIRLAMSLYEERCQFIHARRKKETTYYTLLTVLLCAHYIQMGVFEKCRRKTTQSRAHLTRCITYKKGV